MPPTTELPDHRQVLKEFFDRYCPKPELIEPLVNWTIGEARGGDFLLRGDTPADTCWLIIRGRVEITLDGRFITERHSGDFIGEQAYLQRTIGKPKRQVPQAEIKALGDDVSFFSIGPDFEDQLNQADLRDAKEVWQQTLAAVMNDKLGQAITDRAELRRRVDNRGDWLDRFADGQALELVRTAAYEGRQQVRKREVIIWFSDIANFSKWSERHRDRPDEIGNIARRLTGIQIEEIRAANGLIDKILGDGVMAFWFIDSDDLKKRVPYKAIACAMTVAERIKKELETLGLSDGLDVRIGMHKGKVSFGDFGIPGPKGRIAVTILGDAVNKASRYEAAKATDLPRIRVSPELKHLVDACNNVRKIKFTESVKLKVKETEIDVHGVYADDHSVA
jgi:class 3 adenylate cyclase